MRKRDEISNPNSCLSRAHDDEWVFVLLGRDPAAAAAVRAWIEERIRLGKNRRGDAQIVEAERWVEAATAERNAAPGRPVVRAITCGPPREIPVVVRTITDGGDHADR